MTLTSRAYIENFRRAMVAATEGIGNHNSPYTPESAIQAGSTPYESSLDSFQGAMGPMRLPRSPVTSARALSREAPTQGPRSLSIPLSEGIRTYMGGPLGSRESRVPPALGLAASVRTSPRETPRSSRSARSQSASLRLGGSRRSRHLDTEQLMRASYTTDGDLDRLMQAAIDGSARGPRVSPARQPGLSYRPTIRAGRGVSHELEPTNPRRRNPL